LLVEFLQPLASRSPLAGLTLQQGQLELLLRCWWHGIFGHLFLQIKAQGLEGLGPG
jgi:hypothetical protein